MSSQPPPFLELPAAPDSNSSAVIVFLHGLGDTSEGILPIAKSVRSKAGLNHTKWILPQAPRIPVTGNMHSRPMPSWFDIYSFELPVRVPLPGEEDEAGMLRSIASIDELLSEIVESGVDPSRIVLGGFSQGAAMTLLTGLTTAKKLAGLFVLSARLPLRNKFKSMASFHAPSIPVFWGHGTADPLVTYELGRACADFLISEIGLPAAPASDSAEGLNFHAYDSLPHSVGGEEMEDLASWLKKILPPLEGSG
ncbi:Phospholipase/carboxylesterase/thioesterase [Mycena belliarum]|uniref:Acyl-protein thioesterase 1 n=1 Tax=Mycena belliarum TaxID=1033014 RepID=A0AAD6UF00_9AGAR|nr:Phospholipase/carboxylesterase/thioesterase [Mycena belliae]